MRAVPGPGAVNLLWRRLGGEDGPGRRAVPAGELFHPLTLAAIAVLVVNDWVLKPSPAPTWVTGKLSDVAGLACFPLILTAVVDCALWGLAQLGARVDFTLRRWKLGAAIAVTAAGFAAVKLSPAAAAAVASWLTWVTGHAAIVPDPADLVALPALAVAAWVGRAEIARVPLGRVEYVRRRGRVGDALDDAIACGAPGPAVREAAAALDAWVGGGAPDAAAAALRTLRRGGGRGLLGGGRGA